MTANPELQNVAHIKSILDHAELWFKHRSLPFQPTGIRLDLGAMPRVYVAYVDGLHRYGWAMHHDAAGQKRKLTVRFEEVKFILYYIVPNEVINQSTATLSLLSALLGPAQPTETAVLSIDPPIPEPQFDPATTADEAPPPEKFGHRWVRFFRRGGQS